MKASEKALIALLGAMCIPALASDACTRYQQAQAEVQHAFTTLAGSPNKPAHFKKRLARAQQAWVKYVDEQVRLAYSAPNPQVEYGSALDECLCALRADYYSARAKELQRHLQPMPNGEVCAVPAFNKP